MPIRIEFYNVIIRIKTLNEKYAGGLASYKANCPNKSYKEDEHLTRVGFMGPDSLDKFVVDLLQNGLDFDPINNRSDDFVIISILRHHWFVDWCVVEEGYCRSVQKNIL